MLFEYTKCKKCNHLNPAYKNICTECRSYLRERVVNIDLWNTIQLIIEDPQKAFKQIIFSEHKNFIVFITFFIVIKNLLISRFLSVPELGINEVTTPFILSFILMIFISLILSSSFIFIQNSLYSKKGIKLRFRDIYAVNSYSFIPYLFGLAFIFPVELVVLGGDIFSNNPYSFEIKPLISYILIGFELITILWSFFLIQKSILVISANRFYSIIITLAYFLAWSATLFLSSMLVFSI
jgi:RNA polymerase subunit RPABC4/transcription elongation factor Spt4